ncbi:hypothetical protein FN846DRAFT_531212 [Sphaerosporella brunnea]|uniref:Uncharacterized protein n=1 Tax=Sphaerosporella brunnea TaxID=1250544 RepID=A0A5J5F2V1_9PEZI|nr:hypothetical protein FN846DRAFT_531212 [Sphaerosporella brunnea]
MFRFRSQNGYFWFSSGFVGEWAGRIEKQYCSDDFDGSQKYGEDELWKILEDWKAIAVNRIGSGDRSGISLVLIQHERLPELRKWSDNLIEQFGGTIHEGQNIDWEGIARSEGRSYEERFVVVRDLDLKAPSIQEVVWGLMFTLIKADWDLCYWRSANGSNEVKDWRKACLWMCGREQDPRVHIGRRGGPFTIPTVDDYALYLDVSRFV